MFFFLCLRNAKQHVSQLRIPRLTTHRFTPSIRNCTSPRRVASTVVTVSTVGGKPTPYRSMSSDADYMSFLSKSNKDYSGGESGKKGEEEEVVAKDENAHPAIKALGERFYTSEADEPFVSVSFGWAAKRLPSAEEFGNLCGGEVEKDMDPSEWDVHRKYEDVVEAVEKAAGGGDVKVYMVSRSGSRAEYFIVGVKNDDGKLVGVRAIAVES